MFLRTRFAGSVGAALVAGMLVAVSAPASAAPQPGRPAQADVAIGTSTSEAAVDAKAAKRQYCIRYAVTGSRIERQTCKTKAQWSAVGVDIDNPDQ